MYALLLCIYITYFIYTVYIYWYAWGCFRLWENFKKARNDAFLYEETSQNGLLSHQFRPTPKLQTWQCLSTSHIINIWQNKLKAHQMWINFLLKHPNFVGGYVFFIPQKRHGTPVLDYPWCHHQSCRLSNRAGPKFFTGFLAAVNGKHGGCLGIAG